MKNRTRTKFAISMVLLILLAAVPGVAYVFDSDFAGPDDLGIIDLPEWVDVNGTIFTSRILKKNQGLFTMSKDSYVYSAVRANATVDPMTSAGLRFQYTITKMKDGSFAYELNGTSRLCLADANSWNVSSWTNLGEKFIWAVQWDRSYEEVIFDFRIVNYKESDDVPSGSDVGVSVYNTTVSGVQMDSGEQIRLATEIRDNNDLNDVRVGYQIYNSASSSWGSWVYSAWFDPNDSDGSLGLNDDVDNPSAFGADWKTRWANNTSFYTEQYSPGGIQGSVWIDNVLVYEPGSTQPTNCDELWKYHTQTGIDGDLTKDCEVNFGDIVLLGQVWTSCNIPEDANCIETW